MDLRQRTLEDRSVSFTADATERINLPLDRYISKIDLRMLLDDYDTGTGGSVAEDGILNIIDQVRLEVNADTPRNVDPTRHWYKHPLTLGAQPEFKDVTATEDTGKSAQFVNPLFFRLNPHNPYDHRTPLPARYVDSADLVIEFNSASELGSDHTINSGELQLHLEELLLSRQEEAQLYGATGPDVLHASEGSSLIQMREIEKTKTIDASHDPHLFKVDLPTGGVLRRSFLYAIDNGARDDAIVPKFELEQSTPRDVTYASRTWEHAQQRDKQQYQVDSPIEGDRYLDGLVVLDYNDYVPPNGGNPFDLRGRRPSEVQWAAETNSPTGTSEIRLLTEQLKAADY
jgi:hypothetical protein